MQPQLHDEKRQQTSQIFSQCEDAGNACKTSCKAAEIGWKNSRRWLKMRRIRQCCHYDLNGDEDDDDDDDDEDEEDDAMMNN